MEFLWTKEADLPSFPCLKGDLKTDVLIIGGGMAGILCAHLMQKAKVPYVLVEAKKIGRGITKGTTAVLSAQHDVLYQDLIRQFGIQTANLYLNANLQALENMRKVSQSIPCDFENRPSLMYSLKDKDKLLNEIQALKSIGFHAEFLSEIPFPARIAGAVQYSDMAQFHPLKFLAGIAKDLNIFENTFVRRLEGTVAKTDHGTIAAKKVIVATHFPFINKKGLYFMKLYQMRSFVVALENAPDLGCTGMDLAQDGIYFRNYKNLLILGGGDHRTGKQGGGFETVRKFAKENFPQAKERYAWANQDCISLDGIPYIGRYSPAMPDVFVATGFNEWGMTTSMAAAEVLADLIIGKENEFAKVFFPGRSMLKPQFFINLAETAINFVIPCTKRCSHLGCALRWNPVEHSWDCPCHGSRFDENGKLIDNPAMRDSHVI